MSTHQENPAATNGTDCMTKVWSSTEARHEDSVFTEETTVEVCVKMVVCRKFIKRHIDSTGKVVVTEIREEEDPPTIFNAHTYTIPATSTTSRVPVTNAPKPAFSYTSATSLATPVAGKRRPGRPRKYPPFGTSAGSTANKQEKEASNAQPQITEDQASENAVTADMAIEADSQTPSKSSSSVSHADNAATPVKVKDVALKRGRGRPPRMIKKPRKYLDGVDTEDFGTANLEEFKVNVPPEEEEEYDDDVADADFVVGEEDKAAEEEEAKKEAEESGEGTVSAQLKECPKCGKKFLYATNCQRHMAKENCDEEIKCAFCEQIFSSHALLEEHFETHRDRDNPNTFRCSDCNRCYATRNGFLKHKRQGTCYKRDIFNEDGTQGEFACDLCSTRFTTDKLLALHKDKVHENPVSEFKCLDCGRMFYSKRGYLKHAAKKSCTLPFKCSICGKQYSNKAKESYKAHIKFHMAEASGVQFQCEDCGRVYMTSIALKKHSISHSGIKPFKCSVCHKAFPMRYMVRDHERTHTGEKPFLCSLCGCSFANRGHLYRHLRSHQYGTLHKRGRPRKYPPGTHTLRLPHSSGSKGEKGKEGQQGGVVVLSDGREVSWVKMEPSDAMGEIEIKGDQHIHLHEGKEEDVEGTSVLDSGPTYITVHTVDSSVTDMTSLGEGHFQQVVMESADGVSENVVLQVIQDLTGATTVYQTVGEVPSIIATSSADDSIILTSEGQAAQVVTSTIPFTSGGDLPTQIIVTAAPPKNSIAVSQNQ